jgi:hypothetical protein
VQDAALGEALRAWSGVAAAWRGYAPVGPMTASISPGMTTPEMLSSSVCFGLATTPSSTVNLLDRSCPRGSSSVTNMTFCHTSPRAGVLQIRARTAQIRRVLLR